MIPRITLSASTMGSGGRSSSSMHMIACPPALLRLRFIVAMLTCALDSSMLTLATMPGSSFCTMIRVCLRAVMLTLSPSICLISMAPPPTDRRADDLDVTARNARQPQTNRVRMRVFQIDR